MEEEEEEEVDCPVVDGCGQRGRTRGVHCRACSFLQFLHRLVNICRYQRMTIYRNDDGPCFVWELPKSIDAVFFPTSGKRYTFPGQGFY